MNAPIHFVPRSPYLLYLISTSVMSGRTLNKSTLFDFRLIDHLGSLQYTVSLYSTPLKFVFFKHHPILFSTAIQIPYHILKDLWAKNFRQ